MMIIAASTVRVIRESSVQELGGSLKVLGEKILVVVHSNGRESVGGVGSVGSVGGVGSLGRNYKTYISSLSLCRTTEIFLSRTSKQSSILNDPDMILQPISIAIIIDN